MATDMITDHFLAAPGRGGRARRGRTGLLAAGLVVVGGAVTAGLALGGPAPVNGPAPAPATPQAGWDIAGEAALATRPMLALPEQASAPQPLAEHPAPDGIRLPGPTEQIAGIPAGFPQTPEGAVAALAALTTQGLRGADPQTYSRAYEALAGPGAPPAQQAHLSGVLTDLRSSAGIPSTGPVPNLTMAWRPVQAHIKGVLDGGRYAVVCVLGEFTADYRGLLVAYGVGDCQAMRWTATDPKSGVGGQWRISPGPAAAAAPSAWPGSQDAVNAGYRDILR